MTIEQIISTYGYFGLFFGAILEGETFIIIGGILAEHGLLKLQYVMAVAAIGAFSGDQFFFHLGRLGGKAFIERRPLWKARVERVNRLLKNYQTPMALGFRFIYGIRSATPFVFGLSGFNWKKFLFLNAIGAMIWGGVTAYLGYAFGGLLAVVLSDVKKYEFLIIIVILIIGSGIWGFVIFRSRRKRKKLLMDKTSVKNSDLSADE
ncbi:MAG: DedA family protein [bacterium]|nr:DedA family protein [bacterium]